MQPFVDLTGGFLVFDRITPNRVGTKFNFTADIGGGLEIATSNDRSITVGYKYFHISNGNRGAQNPAFQNNLIYIGYKFKGW